MSVGASAHYRMFGRYNAWANRRLYAAAGRLSVEQYRADRNYEGLEMYILEKLMGK